MWADLAPLVTPSLGGLLALTVILLLTGKLLPVSTVNRLLAQETKRADDYKAAAEAESARADKLADSLGELLPYARTANALMDELRRRIGTEPP